MEVLCVGFGYVGKAYALLLRELGHNVDVLTAPDKTSGEATKYGYLHPYIKDKEYDACIIAVPTPTKNGKQDLSILCDVLYRLNQNYKIKNIIIKSTVLPSKIVKLKIQYKKRNQGFYLYPEFLEAQNPIGGVFNQTCCVLGKDEVWRDKNFLFLSKLFGMDTNKITYVNLVTASMLKYVHNIWLSCNVSFWNAMKRCTRLHNVDYDLVLNETHKSKYFGTHPWHIGTAYGGECLPKDIKAFITSIPISQYNDGVFRNFIKAIDDVNEEVKKNG